MPLTLICFFAVGRCGTGRAPATRLIFDILIEKRKFRLSNCWQPSVRKAIEQTTVNWMRQGCDDQTEHLKQD